MNKLVAQLNSVISAQIDIFITHQDIPQPGSLRYISVFLSFSNFLDIPGR